MKIKGFDFDFYSAGLSDIGVRRKSNQDEVMLAPEMGLFAVSDGMGGIEQGGASSVYVKKALPLMMQICINDLGDLDTAREHLRESVQIMSDRLFEQGNTSSWVRFGATVAGVLLYRNQAIFVGLGDSRGYVLQKYKRNPIQITEDMNVAGILVRNGEMTKEQALGSPESSRLTAFVGMQAPAAPQTWTIAVKPGDRILLCSDGLYGMVPERDIARILRSSRSPEKVCRRLIDRANKNGGRDNISAVYIRIK